MRFFSKGLAAGLLSAAILSGQTLSPSLLHTDSKTSGNFSLVLDSSEDKRPAALQWELSVPAAILIKIEDIGIGKAAEKSKKLLTCAVNHQRPVMPGGMRYACILAGGQAALENGPVAVVQYRVQADVGGAPIRVAVENIVGASADLKRLGFPNVDAILTIKR